MGAAEAEPPLSGSTGMRKLPKRGTRLAKQVVLVARAWACNARDTSCEGYELKQGSGKEEYTDT